MLEALPDDRLSLVFMYGASNDWFFGTAEDGLALFDGSTARSGDVTDAIRLWDAGTEQDEEPAIGAHSGTRSCGGSIPRSSASESCSIE